MALLKYKDVGGPNRIRSECPWLEDGPALTDVTIVGHRKRIRPMQEGRSSGSRPFDFHRYKRGGSNGGGAFNFELEFEEEVCGPLLLGFACHYGLGIFVPAD